MQNLNLRDTDNDDSIVSAESQHDSDAEAQHHKTQLESLWNNLLNDKTLPTPITDRMRAIRLSSIDLNPALFSKLVFELEIGAYLKVIQKYFPRTLQMLNFISRINLGCTEEDLKARRETLLQELFEEFKYFEVDDDEHKRLFRRIEAYRVPAYLKLSVEDVALLNRYSPGYGLLQTEVHSSNLLTAQRVRKPVLLGSLELKKRDLDDDSTQPEKKRKLPAQNGVNVTERVMRREQSDLVLNLDDPFDQQLAKGCLAYTGQHYAATSNRTFSKVIERIDGTEMYEHCLLIKPAHKAVNTSTGQLVRFPKLDAHFSFDNRQKRYIFERVSYKMTNSPMVLSRWECADADANVSPEELALLPRGCSVGAIVVIKNLAHRVASMVLEPGVIPQSYRDALKLKQQQAESGSNNLGYPLSGNKDNDDDNEALTRPQKRHTSESSKNRDQKAVGHSGQSRIIESDDEDSPIKNLLETASALFTEYDEEVTRYTTANASTAQTTRAGTASTPTTAQTMRAGTAATATTAQTTRAATAPVSTTLVTTASRKRTYADPDRLEQEQLRRQLARSQKNLQKLQREKSQLTQQQQEQEQQLQLEQSQLILQQQPQPPTMTATSAPDAEPQPILLPDLVDARVPNQPAVENVSQSRSESQSPAARFTSAVSTVQSHVTATSTHMAASASISTAMQQPGGTFDLVAEHLRQVATPAVPSGLLAQLSLLGDDLPEETRRLLQQAQEQDDAIERAKKETAETAKVALQALIAQQRTALAQAQLKRERLQQTLTATTGGTITTSSPRPTSNGGGNG